jgi:hypothetical protein
VIEGSTNGIQVIVEDDAPCYANRVLDDVDPKAK